MQRLEGSYALHDKFQHERRPAQGISGLGKEERGRHQEVGASRLDVSRHHGYVLGFGRFAGAQMWECNRYGDFDAWREHNDPAWVRIAEEFQEFMTEDVGESVLLREMSDVRVFETKKPKK